MVWLDGGVLRDLRETWGVLGGGIGAGGGNIVIMDVWGELALVFSY